MHPLLPGISEYLYDADMENQLWTVLDENKRVVQCGDAFPWRYTTELPKGSYTLLYQVGAQPSAQDKETSKWVGGGK